MFGSLALAVGGYATYKTIDDTIEKNKVKLIKDVTSGEILSAYVEAPFDKGKEALEKEGYEIISLEENARLRMQEGYDSDVCKKGNWVREAVIYVPNKGKFLTKNSPIMENAKEATDRSRKEFEYYLTDKQIEKALENAVEIKDAEIPTNKSEDDIFSLEIAAGITKTEIPTNRFKDDELTVFAFGDAAEDYGNFLRDNYEIETMNIRIKPIKDKPFAEQVGFYWLDFNANNTDPIEDYTLNMLLNNLYKPGWLRGTLKTPR